MKPFFLGWSELDVTSDMVQHAKRLALLQEAGFPYKTHVEHMGHATRRAGALGAIGEDPDHASLYQIFVQKQDLEKAKYVLRQR